MTTEVLRSMIYRCRGRWGLGHVCEDQGCMKTLLAQATDIAGKDVACVHVDGSALGIVMCEWPGSTVSCLFADINPFPMPFKP